MRRVALLALVALLAAAVAIAAGLGRTRETTSSSVEVSGTIEATEIELRVQAGGEVRAFRFEEGAAVSRSALICELDARKLDQEIAAAEAREGELAAREALLRAGPRSEERRRARAEVLLAETRLSETERLVRVQHELMSRSATSQEALDQADSGARTARAALEVARREEELVLAGARSEEIAAVAAAREAAAREARLARLRLDDLRAVAPIDGTLTERFVEPGEVVPPGGLVATMADLSRLYVKVYVGERELGRVRLGARADVIVDAYPGRTFPGSITRVASKAEFTPRSLQTRDDRVKLVYEAKVDLPNAADALRPGMPCDVRIALAEEP